MKKFKRLTKRPSEKRLEKKRLKAQKHSEKSESPHKECAGPPESTETDRVYLGVALYNYVPEGEDEIPLQKGEEVLVYEQDSSGWWTGECKEKYGLFPGGFVKIIGESKSPVCSPRTEPTPSPPTTPSTAGMNGSVSPLANTTGHDNSEETWKKKYEELVSATTNDKAADEVASIRQTASEASEQRDSFEKQLTSLQQEHEDLQAKYKELQGVIESMQTKANSTDDYESVESELEHWLGSDKSRALESTVETLKAKVSHLQGQLKTAKADQLGAETVMRELEEERDRLKLALEEDAKSSSSVNGGGSGGADEWLGSAETQQQNSHEQVQSEADVDSTSPTSTSNTSSPFTNSGTPASLSGHNDSKFIRELIARTKNQERELLELRAKLERSDTLSRMELLALPDQRKVGQEDIITQMLELRRKLDEAVSLNKRYSAELASYKLEFTPVLERPKGTAAAKSLTPAEIRARRLSNYFLHTDGGKTLKPTGIKLVELVPKQRLGE